MSSNDHSSNLCTCQCHKTISSSNNDYLLFEQALKKTRLEEEKDKSLNNNRLIQTLKRQHDELIQIYQQNKTQKQILSTKIDREQQTNKLNLHDSQIQTDLTTTINNSKTISPSKSLGLPTASRKHTIPLPNSNQTLPSSSSLQQSIPGLSKTATVTNKTSTVTTKTAIVMHTQTTLPNSHVYPPPPPPPLSSTVVPHDIVDLTEEEDEDDHTSRVPIQRTTSTRQVKLKLLYSIFSL